MPAWGVDWEEAFDSWHSKHQDDADGAQRILQWVLDRIRHGLDGIDPMEGTEAGQYLAGITGTSLSVVFYVAHTSASSGELRVHSFSGSY